jgi:hypothetical protein
LVEIKSRFLIGFLSNTSNLYIAEIAHESKTPFITATGAGEIIYNQGFDFVYGIMSPARCTKGTIDTLIDEHPNENPRQSYS